MKGERGLSDKGGKQMQEEEQFCESSLYLDLK